MLSLGRRGLWLGLATAAAAAMAARLMGWWSPRADFRLFIPEELARYRGRPGDRGLYLALLGRVYDVSSGRRHYEPGAHYSGFAGRDASRAFVTGDYSEGGLVDDVSDLSFSEMLTLQSWLSFYEQNYEFIGRVTGRFYGEDGLPTPELTQAEAMITKGLEANKQELKEKQKFPPCNAEWSSTRGSRFWCSQRSGGVSRDWIGVPRKLFKPGINGHKFDQLRANWTDTQKGSELQQLPFHGLPGCPDQLPAWALLVSLILTRTSGPTSFPYNSETSRHIQKSHTN
ncbi:neuferricin isoform X2 [Globicephala melas]|uniref:neuferricin isoform X2 n=1 Tax=Globicephala melas TaxID=9731 RepID=UPI00293D53CB|nr:neuferricin isoform X2 [Globicephala melas]XP_060147189.1 neuferricin isoform X2 [Globicephala melas]